MRLTAVAGSAGLAHVIPGAVMISPRAQSSASHTEAASSLLAQVSEYFDESIHAGIHLGPPRANRKPVLQLVNDAGRTVGFAKVGINDLTNARVRHEGEVLAELGRHNFGVLELPKLRASGTWRDCAYVVMEPVATWTPSESAPERVGAAMQALVGALPTHTSALADLPWWVGVRQGLAAMVASDRGVDAGGDEATLLDRANRIERDWGSHDLTVGASHGDWTPWNMAAHRDRVVVWDWERFDVATPVGWDGLHFYFQRAVAEAGGDVAKALHGTHAWVKSAVAMNGADPDSADLLYQLYLVNVGYRFTKEGQLRAGSRRGPLSRWLIPALDQVMSTPNER